MRVLITGGCGFIGSHIAERFFKEGHQIFIIDNLSTGAKENLGIQHKLYELNVVDKKCEEVFKTNNLDVVIHLAAQVDVSLSTQDPYLDSESNILGLINILDLSRKYGVKKLVFASSAAVYGDTQNLPIPETTPSHPMSIYGINKFNGEEYCHKWKELYGLETVVLRFANVYGPRQGIKGEAGVISIFMKQMMEDKEIVVYGDGSQTRDYVYVEDVADAIYRVVNSTCQYDVMNISTNTESSLKSLINTLSQSNQIKNIRYEAKRSGDIYKSRLDNSRVMQELKWTPKYTLQEGLEKTYQWYESDWGKRTVAATLTVKAPSMIESSFFKTVRPYLENLILFGFMILLNVYSNYDGIINTSIGLDYNYIYIGTMGILYGKRQSLPATALATILLIYGFLSRGADFVSIMYQSQQMVHFATYLFVGVVTGYVSDSRERVTSDLNITLRNLKEQYNFLKNMYSESNQTKDALYKQIVNSDNTIGKTYSVIRELDSLEVENIFTAANKIVAETMKTEAVAIYIVGKNKDYLRQKIKTGTILNHLPKSIKIQDHEYVNQMMEDKRVFTNKFLTSECPNMAAPIIYGGQVIGVIQIYNLPFENLTLYHENLLKITAMLISDVLGKAYLYELGVHDKKYIGATRILIVEEFEKIQTEIDRRKSTYETELSIVLLRIIAKELDYNMIDKGLEKVIRDEDYIGLRQDGQVYVLLTNITPDMVLKVQERLKITGLDSVDVTGEQHE